MVTKKNPKLGTHLGLFELRFFLSTLEEFDAFWLAYKEEMPSKTFHHEPTVDEEVDQEVDGDG
jgi:hypothetical protein